MPKRADQEKPAGVLDLDNTPRMKAPKNQGHDLEQMVRTATEWMTIDNEGQIHVRGGRFSPDRVVGRIQGGDTGAILASLILRFTELEDRYSALEQELKRSRNPARNLKKLHSFRQWVEGAEAIGDFDSLLGKVHARVEKLEGKVDTTLSTKLALVERAEALADSTQWNSTAEVMDEIMNEWKAAGSAGRDDDDALWERFRAARRTFSNHRSKHYSELKKSRTSARDAKRDLIKRSAELADSTDWETTSDAMQALMDEWKQAGSAGRNIDDELWHHFREAREPFFAARKAHFAQQRQQQRQQQQPPRDDRRDRGPRDRGGRRPGGRNQNQASPGARRVSSQGSLHASLAEIVGPLRDLFPAEREKKNDGKADGKKQKS